MEGLTQPYRREDIQNSWFTYQSLLKLLNLKSAICTFLARKSLIVHKTAIIAMMNYVVIIKQFTHSTFNKYGLLFM